MNPSSNFDIKLNWSRLLVLVSTKTNTSERHTEHFKHLPLLDLELLYYVLYGELGLQHLHSLQVAIEQQQAIGDLSEHHIVIIVSGGHGLILTLFVIVLPRLFVLRDGFVRKFVMQRFQL